MISSSNEVNFRRITKRSKNEIMKRMQKRLGFSAKLLMGTSIYEFVS